MFNILIEQNSVDTELKNCGNINSMKKEIKNHNKDISNCQKKNCETCKKIFTGTMKNT